jgi:HEAT repeat protein
MFTLCLSSLLTVIMSFQPSEIDALIRQLGSPKFAERQAATKRLEAIGDRAAEALRNAAASNPDPEIRRRAEALLAGMIGHDIPGKESRDRQRAVLALGQRAPQAALPLLQKALQDKDLSVRWRAAYTLWRVDPRRGPEAIKVIEGVREAWMERLPDLPGAAAVEETQALLFAALEILDGKPKPAS